MLNNWIAMIQNLYQAAPPAQSLPCGANDLICQLGTQVHEIIPQLIDPMAGVVSQHPYAAAGLFFAAGATAYLLPYSRRYVTKEVRNNTPNFELAISGIHKCNCGFHGILHNWLSLSDEHIRGLYEVYPVYHDLLEHFFQYYGIPDGANSSESLILLKNTFSHPVLREIIWGPILRQLLRAILMNDGRYNDMATLVDKEFASDDLLGALTNRMGGRLIVHNLTDDPMIGEVECYDPYDTEPSWTAELYGDNNHFNFTFPEKAFNYVHNEHRNRKDEILSQVLQFAKNPRAQECILRVMMQTLFNVPKEKRSFTL